VIEALLAAGAALAARRNDGRTPYALAVQSGQTAVAKLLQKLQSFAILTVQHMLEPIRSLG